MKRGLILAATIQQNKRKIMPVLYTLNIKIDYYMKRLMKQLKFGVILFAVAMSVTMTSCMDGNNESPYDAAALVTVSETLYGGVVLTTDDGYRLIPTNPDMLKISATEYIERVQIIFKWGEGVVFDRNHAKTYQITVVGREGIPTKELCNRPDTIQKNYPLASFYGVSGANGEYLNIAFSFNYTYSTERISFDLYPVKATDDELTMKLSQSVGTEGYITSDQFMSFTLPSLNEINALLSQYQGQYGVEGGALQQSDSIWVKVIADGKSDQLVTKPVKIKITY